MRSAATTIKSFVASMTLLLAVMASTTAASAAPGQAGDPPGRDPDVIAHWTAARVASAQPRDLTIDHRGLAYLKAADGSLTPYGHRAPYRLQQTPVGASIMAKPGTGGDDTAGPDVINREPADGATVGASVSLRATITDPSGVKSVSFVVVYPNGRTQSFSAGSLGNDAYGADLSGFSDGEWGWYVVAKDTVKGGNTTTTSTSSFTVDTSGNGGGDIVANSRWTKGGEIQFAAGRILFEMPTLRGKRTTWDAYVCSGTTVVDSNTGASVIITAAHCVYDDVAKAFARNVLFIPSQDDGGSDGTDSDCSNDPIDCFTPSHGVVDVNWTTNSFPDNVEWDYAYYVVPGSELENNQMVNPQTIQFTSPVVGDTTHALGYSYSDDPFFMYCAEPLGVETPGVNWWLGSCDLSGGSSGGPWIQPMDEATGSGPIVSVNSWGYTTQSGMAGPLLDDSAQCVFAQANNANATVTDRGVIVSGC